MSLSLFKWLNYYYLGLFECFPFFLRFRMSLIKFTLWNLERPRRLKFFYRQEVGDTGCLCLCLGRPCKVLLGFSLLQLPGLGH